MPSNNDGRVIINIDSNASKAQREFEALDTAFINSNNVIPLILKSNQLTMQCLILS